MQHIEQPLHTGFKKDVTNCDVLESDDLSYIKTSNPERVSRDIKDPRDKEGPKKGTDSYDVSWDLSNTNMTNFERSEKN